MSKDSQMDPKEIRAAKANGQTPINDDAQDGESRNAHKQSGSRHKPGNMKSNSE